MYQFMAKSAGYKTVCKKQFIGKSDWKDSLKITNSLQKVRDKTQSSLKITNSLQKMRGKTQSFFNTSLCQKRVTRQSLYKNTSFIAKSRSLHIFHSKRDVIIVRLALEIKSTALSHKIK